MSMANTKQIDLKSVEELASLGLTDQQIADSLGISRSTLSRRKTDDDTFDTALRKGKAQAIVKEYRECLKLIILYLVVYSMSIEKSIFIGLPCYSKSTPLYIYHS